MDSTAQTSGPKFICAAFIDISVAVEEGEGEGSGGRGSGSGTTHYSDWINQSPPLRGIWELEGQILLNSSVGKVMIYAGGLQLTACVRACKQFVSCRLENKKVADMRRRRDSAVFPLGW